MGELTVKEVEFLDDRLVAVQNSETGAIYVGVTWICKGLGVDARRQREKLQQHPTLSKGVATLPLPSTGGSQDTLVVELDYVPLWLATLNPSLVAPELVDKLVDYQLKAKDVLASAFLPSVNLVPLDERKVRMELLKTAIDHEGRIEHVEKRIEHVERKVDEQITIDHGEQRRMQKAVASRIYGLSDDKEERSRMFRELYREIKDRWAVGSYRDVRRSELGEVLRYIDAWRPRLAA